MRKSEKFYLMTHTCHTLLAEMFPSPSGEFQQFIHLFQIFIKRRSVSAGDRGSLFKKAVPHSDGQAGGTQWSFAAATDDFLMRYVSCGL